MSARFSGITLHEAIEWITEDDTIELRNIFIDPPDAGVITDEDSGAEDDAGTVDNLPRRQLCTNSEVILCASNVDDEDVCEQEINSVPNKKIKRTPKQWKNQDLETTSKIFPEFSYDDISGLSIVEIVERFLDSDVVEFLVKETNNYACFKNEPNLNVSQEEIRVVIAIFILSGYNTVPSKRCYWEDAPDVHSELVCQAMRRNRFLDICRFLHCADNNRPNLSDKMWKLRPFINLIKRSFKNNFHPEEHMNYDESMIAYYGRHGCKQFIRGKPIRFGFKAWCLNTSSSFLLDFDIYQGKDPNSNDQYGIDYGKASAPLVKMLDNLEENVKKLPYQLYMDNLFTGMKLLTDLKSRNYGATGTMRENRVPKDSKLPHSKELKKEPRATYRFRTSKDEGIVICKWVDNSVVTVASTSFGIHPIANVGRYSREQKKRIEVARPNLIGEYNKHMGGTDRMDQNIGYYRIGIRSKKWWFSIFTWLLDAAITNAWVLARNSGNKVNQIDFRRCFVQTYLVRYKHAPKLGRRPLKMGTLATENVKSDGIGHLVKYIDDGKRRRCAGNQCKSICRTMCLKCNVGLCIECFIPYHTK